MNLGIVLAPSVGGMLFQHHLGLAYAIDGLTTLSSTILIFLFIKDITPVTEKKKNVYEKEQHTPVSYTHLLFKAFGDVDAFPLCIKSQDVDEIVNTIYLISGSFGGVNLEDIAAPRCFEIEKKLKEKCDIPIFHDDQHGTAAVSYTHLF